jgi:tight adherence protein C
MDFTALIIACFWGLLIGFGSLKLVRLAGRGQSDRQLVGKQGSPLLAAAAAVGRPLSRIASVEKKTRIRKKLISAGFRVDPAIYIGAQALLCPVFGLAGNLIDGMIGTEPALTLGLLLVGWVYPGIWLKGKIQRRQRRIFRDMPDFLDVLRLSVAAGLDFSSALHVVVDNSPPGPLLEEFEWVERDIVLGKTRANALEAMADRVDMPHITSFVMAVRQAEDLGAPIAPLLNVQSQVAREQRWQLAEAIAGKLPTKLLGPLVTCIFPASFIVLFTPLVIDYLSSGF